VLEHDLWQQSVEIATGYILPDTLAKRIAIEPVVECLYKPLMDVYIELNDNRTNLPAASGGEYCSFALCIWLFDELIPSSFSFVLSL
jgi:hypothetical protein